MKKIALCIMSSYLFVGISLAYTYEIYEYSPSDILYNDESIIFYDEGGMYELTLFDSSSATINGTSDLIEGSGGIWLVSMSSDSSLEMSDGQIHELAIHNYATAYLSGGLIQQIWSSQNAWTYAGDPPVLVPNPHITIVYSGDLPDWDAGTNILTGLWGSGDPFSIQLIDVSGYDPAIENIQFELIPEPATIVLLGLGGLLIRKRK